MQLAFLLGTIVGILTLIIHQAFTALFITNALLGFLTGLFVHYYNHNIDKENY